MGGALGKGDVLDARSFLITLAPAGPAPAMFAPELELLLLFLSLSFLMKEGLKLPILKFFFSFLFSVVEETVESSFLGKLNSGTVLNGSPNPVSLRVAVFGLLRGIEDVPPLLLGLVPKGSCGLPHGLDKL